MGFKDSLVRQKDGSYLLKSKTKKAKKDGVCVECGENSKARDLMYQYNTEDMILVRNHIENHLFMHPKHKSVTPEWCDTCKTFKRYVVKVGYE
jgi:hypothetical protein|tara:strand:- start:298 stop:576 length:279 start_codon:yes stop_codon:yes gene_type:complete